MALVPTSLPALEPITLAQAKAHLRLDSADEDALVAGLIAAARLHLEEVLARAMITQSWSYLFDRWPAGSTVRLPLAPVQSITVVRVYGIDDAAVVLPADTYILDGQSRPPRLVRRAALAWPRPGRNANGIEIVFVAGHGSLPAEVPQPLRQAILLLVAHWFERREPIEIGTTAIPLPGMVDDLVAPYRVKRL